MFLERQLTFDWMSHVKDRYSIIFVAAVLVSNTWRQLQIQDLPQVLPSKLPFELPAEIESHASKSLRLLPSVNQ